MDTTFKKSKLSSFLFDPFAKTFSKPSFVYDNDVILFTDACSNFPVLSTDNFQVFGGRSSNIDLQRGQKLSLVLNLNSSDKKLLKSSLYSSEKSACVIPMGDKTAVIFNRLYRFSGLGIAVIFDYAEKYASEIYHSELLEMLEDFEFSERFADIEGDDDGAMSFASSICDFKNNINAAMGRASEGKSDLDLLLDMICACCNISGCRAKIAYELGKSPKYTVDKRAFASLMIGILSYIRSVSSDREAVIELTSEDLGLIELSFNLSGNAGITDNVSEIFYCNKIANDFKIPFSFNLSGNNCKIAFTPVKVDPSKSGFKSGIYINGSQITKI